MSFSFETDIKKKERREKERREKEIREKEIKFGTTRLPGPRTFITITPKGRVRGTLCAKDGLFDMTHHSFLKAMDTYGRGYFSIDIYSVAEGLRHAALCSWPSSVQDMMVESMLPYAHNVFNAFFREPMSPVKRDQLMRCTQVHVWKLVNAHAEEFMENESYLNTVMDSFERQGHHMLCEEAWEAFIPMLSRFPHIATRMLNRVAQNPSVLGTHFIVPVARAIIDGAGWDDVKPELYYSVFGTAFGDFWKSLRDIRVAAPIDFDGFPWEILGNTCIRDNDSLFNMVHLHSHNYGNLKGFLELSKIATREERARRCAYDSFSLTPIEMLEKAIRTQINPPEFLQDHFCLQEIRALYDADSKDILNSFSS